MIILARQDPLITPGGYTYAKTPGGYEYETVPWVRVDNLWLRGDYTLETPEGPRALKSLRIGDTISFYPEPVRAFGSGFMIKSGDLSRPLSPSEAWSLAAGWFSPPEIPLSRLREMTQRPAEMDVLMNGENTFLAGGLGVFFNALSRFSTFQLQGLLRGIAFAVSVWDQGFRDFSTDTKRLLMSRLVGTVGRFAAHMGLIFTQGWRKRFIPEAISSLDARICPGKYVSIAHDTFPLKVRQVWQTKIKVCRKAEGTNARVPGLRIQGLVYESPIL